MKLNLHLIVAIGCLVSPLASIAQSPVLPAFSDDNWISLGGSPGANNQVNASVVDASGNLSREKTNSYQSISISKFLSVSVAELY